MKAPQERGVLAKPAPALAFVVRFGGFARLLTLAAFSAAIG